MSVAHSRDQYFCQMCQKMGCDIVLWENTVNELRSQLASREKVLERYREAILEAIKVWKDKDLNFLGSAMRADEILRNVLHPLATPQKEAQ